MAELVVWQSMTPTQTLQSRIGATSWDILGYNLGNGNHLAVANSPADETNPAISGNVVVWQTYRTRPPRRKARPSGWGAGRSPELTSPEGRSSP